MEQELWGVFADCGEPMCYLLLKASEHASAAAKNSAKNKAIPSKDEGKSRQ